MCDRCFYCEHKQELLEHIRKTLPERHQPDDHTGISSAINYWFSETLHGRDDEIEALNAKVHVLKRQLADAVERLENTTDTADRDNAVVQVKDVWPIARIRQLETVADKLAIICDDPTTILGLSADSKDVIALDDILDAVREQVMHIRALVKLFSLFDTEKKG